MRTLFILAMLAALRVRAEEAPEAAKRVTYVPETVKAEIREQVKQEVLEQAKRENWVAPNAVPSWVQRLKPFGDVRLRFERDLFARGNAGQGEFPDFAGINAGKPFDLNGVDPSNERYLDVDQNRTRPRLRARAGLEADLGNGFSALLRVGSGESNNPGSANQTLTSDFSRYQFWLDGAAVRYSAFEGALALRAGKFDNPFWGSEMIWAPDVMFDGVAATVALRHAFFTAGAFPLYTTPLAFPVERTDKLPSRNRWLYAGQAGVQWGGFKGALAFYGFDKVEGRRGTACDTNFSFVTCDTDDSRTPFAQKGNSYLMLRSPSAAALALEATGTAAEYQYFGLASRFRELVATARYDLPLAPALSASAEAEYVFNAGFNKRQVAAVALNNRGGTETGSRYQGGQNGVMARVSLGTPAQDKAGDWRVRVQYRYLQSDAVLDALNDQDFGLGGTNLKGYAIDALVALGGGVSFNARWFSANQIVGPRYGVDVLQLDLQARF